MILKKENRSKYTRFITGPKGTDTIQYIPLRMTGN